MKKKLAHNIHKLQHRYHNLSLGPHILISLVTLLTAVIVGTVIGTYAITFHTSKTQPETEQTEMKHIPQDVQKEIQKQTQIASISGMLQIPILMYHYVEYVKDPKDTERQLLNVNPNVFEQQIQTLLAAGYTFITAKELGDILKGDIPEPKNSIVLTFDDGHWDLDTNVIPILKKYNVHATAYIVPGFIGVNSDSLTQSQMQDVVASGLIDVGAHTVHHISLKGKPLALVQSEVNQSKNMLEQLYHTKVYSFAYPYGSFDQQSINVVKQAGFTTAASTIAGGKQGEVNKFFLYRIRPGYKTGLELLNYLHYWETIPIK